MRFNLSTIFRVAILTAATALAQSGTDSMSGTMLNVSSMELSNDKGRL